MKRILLSSILVLALLAAPGFAADQPRKVPDTPVSFALTGNARWIVVA